MLSILDPIGFSKKEVKTKVWSKGCTNLEIMLDENDPRVPQVLELLALHKKEPWLRRGDIYTEEELQAARLLVVCPWGDKTAYGGKRFGTSYGMPGMPSFTTRHAKHFFPRTRLASSVFRLPSSVFRARARARARFSLGSGSRAFTRTPEARREKADAGRETRPEQTKSLLQICKSHPPWAMIALCSKNSLRYPSPNFVAASIRPLRNSARCVTRSQSRPA